jgi:hypothetical protein
MEFTGTIAAIRPLQKGAYISFDTDQNIYTECDKLMN